MYKSIIPIFIILFFLIGSIHSQQIDGTKGKAVKQAKVEVRLLPQESDKDQQFKVPNPGWNIPKWTYDKSNILYKQPLTEAGQQKTDTREVSPIPDTTFTGLMDDGTSIPPDVNGAAGPDHLMQTLNTDVRISDKTGIDLFTTSLSLFWSPMPGSNATFDPKIVYDPYNERWITMTPSGGNAATTRLYVGVSTTSNPLDDWFMYWIDPDTTNQLWFDYPNLGFNKNWISIGGIMRNSAFEAVDFVVFAINMEDMLNGEEEVDYSRFTTQLGSAIVPSFTYDPDQEELYLISTGDGNDEGFGYVNLFKISGETDNPVFELKGSIGIPEPWENWSYENHGDFLPQMGSSEKLNSVDARMHTMINRNNKLWAVHHIYLPADDPQRTSIQWWNLDTNGVILERGRIDDPINEFSFAYPSIAVNANEDVLIGHGVFSESQYAGAAYSFKSYLDDPNTTRTYYQYKEGLAPYYKTFGSGRNRWGDYSAVCVDPEHDVDFWAVHEYAELPSGSDQWGTWWAFLQPSFPPAADFTSDEIIIPTGETVYYTDLTLGVPMSWEWAFEQGQPENSDEQNPVVTYDEEGVFDVMLIASNELGTDTLIKEDHITVSSAILPEVEFRPDKLVACTGEVVSFADLSLYSPIQWEWQFDPASVTFVNGTDQSSQNPQVVFNEATSYAATLTVWNLNGSSELTKFDLIVAGGYPIFYHETFEPETFKPEEWVIENPDNDITWDYYEIGGTFPGNMAAGVDLSNYYDISERDRLISPPLNLNHPDFALLDFKYAYAKRIPELTDSLIIYISDDCGENWTRIFAGGEDGTGIFATHEQVDEFWPEVAEDWCGSGWGAECVTLDLSPWADSPNVKLAFETWSGFGNPLFVDNVTVSVYLGEDENAEPDKVVVYPNPSKDYFNISLPNHRNFSEIKLVNSFGQVLYQTNISNKPNNITIPLNKSWPRGVYFIQLYSDESVVVKEAVIR